MNLSINNLSLVILLMSLQGAESTAIITINQKKKKIT